MKKFLIIIGLFCGIVGDSWAVCELTESTDVTPSNEDLYSQNPNDSRMALICEKGKCGDGEIVFAKAGHYRKRTLVNENTFYECKLAADDRWEAVYRDLSFPICGDDISDKEMITSASGATLGRKQADNLYTDICWKKYEEKCGVECNDRNNDKTIVCDDTLFLCGGKYSHYDWVDEWGAMEGCDYSDPENRIIGEYTFVLTTLSKSIGVAGEMIFAKTGFTNGDFFNYDQVCVGCDSGSYRYYDVGSRGYHCIDNKDEAWCYWRKNKESKNTEWKDNACNCLDSGMEWNTEKHDCVKKKGGGKTNGGSGKTGGGKTNGGKQGGKTSTTSDIMCGVKCDSNMFDKPMLCMGDDDSVVFYCDKDTKEWKPAYPRAHTCPYSDPEKPNVAGLKFLYANDEFGKLYSDNNVKNGDILTKEYRIAHNMCWVCPAGKYYDIALDDDFSVGVGDASVARRCMDDREKAWCNWQKVKANMNVKWENNTCKCLDSGKKWDATSHTCVADGTQQGNSGKGDKKPQPKNDKIDCSFELGAVVRCRDGVQFSKNVSVSVMSSTCDVYKSNVAKYVDEIAQLLCESRGGVDNMVTDAQVKNAADNLDRFFTSAEANANVWKNAEGKFNTARLASDATAGVILGTVGGIVSANIIKKKQVEKGFDALNCTIGGQKVADWGDEFSVGLHR